MLPKLDEVRQLIEAINDEVECAPTLKLYAFKQGEDTIASFPTHEECEQYGLSNSNITYYGKEGLQKATFRASPAFFIGLVTLPHNNKYPTLLCSDYSAARELAEAFDYDIVCHHYSESRRF